MIHVCLTLVAGNQHEWLIVTNALVHQAAILGSHANTKPESWFACRVRVEGLKVAGQPRFVWNGSRASPDHHA